MQRAEARIDLTAIEANCRLLAGALRPPAVLAAVVKANAYGHGAVVVARAALAGGARMLCVAAAAEASELRAAGIDEPVLIMGALIGDELAAAVAARAEVVAWSEQFVSALARHAAAADPPAPLRVHVKLDTGMGRLGTRDPAEADRVAAAVEGAPALALAGAMTHLASADEDPEFMAVQLARFEPWAERMRARVPGLVVHAANSAATLRDPGSHFDLVRCGIAVYGMDPFGADPAEHGLRPALELRSYVAAVKPIAVGESAGYGRRFTAARPGWIATLPVGYADGVRRALTNNADVLIGGRRRPLVGTVSMDNVTVLLDDPRAARVGEEAVLIGARGEERILAEEWARRLHTINYEVTCGIGPRVVRSPHRDGSPA